MKVCIIGGGASGIVASIFSKNYHNEVILLEKNGDCLKKLLITGNGKCNFFNDDFSISHYHSSNINYLDNLFTSFNKNMVLDFIKSIGISFINKNGYYYPMSNQAYSIHNALIKEANIRGVEIKNNSNVIDIKKVENKFNIYLDDDCIECDKVVISTGSYSYPKTGSTGDGYKFSKNFSHNIKKVIPGLVQLVSSDKFISKLSGVRCNCMVSLNNKHEVGEIQFTDYGISGICVYNLSILANKLLDDRDSVLFKVNFLYNCNIEDYNGFIDIINNYNSSLLDNRNITDLLEGFLNYKIVNTILDLSGIDSNSKWNNITYEDKVKLGKLLTEFNINIISSKGFDNAQVCLGGVSLDEVDCSCFKSKLVDGLFFTGELLDVVGDCGGYNLGFAFLSGMIVGKYIGDIND